jgi:replicative DNA helicase
MTPDFDKLPPHSVEAEMSLIGSLMLDGNNATLWAEVNTLVKREHFYRDDHAVVFDTLAGLSKGGVPVDAVSLRDRLQNAGKLDEVGGVPYLGQLLHSVPSSAHAPHYANIVRQAAIGRALIRLAGDVLRDAYSPNGVEFHDLANRHAARFTALASRGATHAIKRLGELAMEWYEEASTNKPPPLLQTGFLELDDCIGGLPLGGFTQIWGRPGMGKSALAKAIARRLGEGGTPVGIVSVEESGRKIATNAISGAGRVESWRFQHGRFANEDLAKALAGVNKLFNWPIYIGDYPVKISEVESCITLMVQRHGCRAVFVDHLHIIDGETDANRTAEVTKISGVLKSVGKRLGIAIIGCCQLNRGQSRDEYASKPQLRDARDSGALEQDGDLIIGVFREDWNRMQRGDPTRDGQMLAIILKNKFGRSAEIPLLWEGDYQEISDWKGPMI